jgi:hypothetical protein
MVTAIRDNRLTPRVMLKQVQHDETTLRKISARAALACQPKL